MMHSMVKINSKAGEVLYTIVPEENTENFLDLVAEYDAEGEVFPAGKMPFEALPEETQAQVKTALRTFDKAIVTYEGDQFRVHTSTGLYAQGTPGARIYAQYAYDHCTCGYYRQEEIYTKEERAKNFKEEFGYVPFYLA